MCVGVMLEDRLRDRLSRTGIRGHLGGGVARHCVTPQRALCVVASGWSRVGFHKEPWSQEDAARRASAEGNGHCDGRVGPSHPPHVPGWGVVGRLGRCPAFPGTPLSRLCLVTAGRWLAPQGPHCPGAELGWLQLNEPRFPRESAQRLWDCEARKIHGLELWEEQLGPGMGGPGPASFGFLHPSGCTFSLFVKGNNAGAEGNPASSKSCPRKGLIKTGILQN